MGKPTGAHGGGAEVQWLQRGPAGNGSCHQSDSPHKQEGGERAAAPTTTHTWAISEPLGPQTAIPVCTHPNVPHKE